MQILAGNSILNVSDRNEHSTVLSYTKEEAHLTFRYIVMKKASVHDALTSVEAFAQMMDMNHDLHPKYACLDCASQRSHLPVFPPQ